MKKKARVRGQTETKEIKINSDARLEKEADRIGAKSAGTKLKKKSP